MFEALKSYPQSSKFFYELIWMFEYKLQTLKIESYYCGWIIERFAGCIS